MLAPLKVALRAPLPAEPSLTPAVLLACRDQSSVESVDLFNYQAGKAFQNDIALVLSMNKEMRRYWRRFERLVNYDAGRGSMVRALAKVESDADLLHLEVICCKSYLL